MWLIGLLVGAVAGAVLDDGRGLVLGAIAGAILAWTLARKSRPAADDRLAVMEDAIRQLNRRLKALEQARDGTQPAAPQSAVPDAAETAGAAPPFAQTMAAGEAGLQSAAAVFRDPQTPDVVEAAVFAGAAAASPPPAAPAPQPSKPAGQSWWDRLIGGNIVAKIGVVVLFLGVGFLLKYAYDNALLPVPLRLAGVALAGAGMFIAGWRLLDGRRLYGLILQGGGIGLLYLDVFFALRVYALIAPQWGFACFLLLGAAATLLAVKQDARILAVLGLSGAFMAPVLAGSETGSHVLLFSYYLLLNAFILAVSWFKAWRSLNLVGFGFTFIVGLLWGEANYRPEHFATVQPFVLVFFAMYLVIPMLFALRQPPQLKGLVDGTLVFGTPLASAFMQAGLVRDLPYGLAWSAGGAALLYALLTLTLWRREGMRVLAEAYLALAVALGTLTIAFALDAYPTFALWTLEGAAIVWIGLRQQHLAARLFGLALQAAGAVYFLSQYDSYDLAHPWFNDFVLGCFLIAAASLLTSGLMHRYRDILIRGGEATAALLLFWGCLWWFVGGLHMLDHGLPRDTLAPGALAFIALSVLAADLVGDRARWPAIRRSHFVLLTAMVLIACDQFVDRNHPFEHYGWLAWPLAALLFYWTLSRQERAGVATAAGVQHVLALWLFTVLAAWELAWQFRSHGFGFGWRVAMWGLVPAAVLGAISRYGSASAWPFAQHAAAYRGMGLSMLAAWCALWSLSALGEAGRFAPLPYMPLLNPLDAAQVAAILALVLWLGTRERAGQARPRLALFGLGVLGFLALNSFILRAVHHWAGVRYTLDAMLGSVLAQSALSLVWTSTALGLMIYATRAARRAAWIAGALLLAVVVGKLFMLDLANSGTVERIVTFIGVGMGLLAVGYFAPVPPGGRERTD